MFYNFFVHTKILIFILFLAPLKLAHSEQTADAILSKHDVAPRRIRTITVTDVIEQGLRKNFAQQDREHQGRVLTLNWQDARESFWMPQFQLELTSNPQRLLRLKSGRLPDGNSTLSGTLAIKMEEYTLFNWGKDQLSHLNTQDQFIRDNQSLKDERRGLRYQILIQYSRLIRLHSAEAVFKEQLHKSAFIYRFAREKAKLGKLSAQEFSAARSEYLRAQSELQIAQDSSRNEDARMARMIVDPPATGYLLNGAIKYQKLRFPLDKGRTLAEKNNPQILKEQKNVEISERQYNLIQRENYPLPKISINVGAYRHHWESAGSLGRYETNGTNSNLDIVAEIKASWPLNGKGSLFNQRKIRGGQIQAEQSRSRLNYARHQADSRVENHYRTIKSLEAQMAVARARKDNAQKNFDLTMENYINLKTRFSAFHQALDEMVRARVHFLSVQQRHFEEKVLLAEAIGIDDFPEERLPESLRPKKKSESL